MPELLKEEILKKTEQFVKDHMEGDRGHDWWHIHRVRNTALSLAEEEQANLFIVELAALLHDVADHKFHGGDETIGPKVAREWLLSLQIDEKTISHVCKIIKDISFKGAEVDARMQTLEGKVVQDADRLDAMGAIGIARAFSYGGYRNRELYNPNQKPIMHSSFDEYKKDEGHTINHFYEKLFLLKDRMNTKAGKELAKERHEFMKTYIQQFLKEWDEKN